VNQLAKPITPPKWAQLPWATMRFGLLAQQPCHADMVVQADGTVDEGHVDFRVIHGCHVAVTGIQGNRPEDDLRFVGNGQQVLGQVDDRLFTAAAARTPIQSNFRSIPHSTILPSGELPTAIGPNALIVFTMSLTTWA
jgi:hypothetical protein